MAEPQQTPETQASQPGDAMMASQPDDATLNSQYDDDETSGLDETVEANRGREQGLGMGARELNAQQDGGEDEIDSAEDGDGGDDLDEILDENVAVQGEDDEEEEENGGGV